MTNQVILRELVTGMGHRFTLAEDGEAALTALATADYDLLLLDSRMPRLDGIDVLNALRAGQRDVRQSDLAVIAVTANAGPEERARFLDAGAEGFLPKPIDEHALQSEIGRVIRLLLARGYVLPANDREHVANGGPIPQVGAGETAIATTTVAAAMTASPAMRQVFLAEGPRLLADLGDALAAGDGATATRAAHSLKGMAGYFAAPDLEAPARAAEAAADAGQLGEAKQQCVLMAAAVERVVAILRSEQAALPQAPLAQPPIAAPTLSREQLQNHLHDLEGQLARNSLDAEATLTELRASLPAGPAADLGAQMARHLETFDFAQAKSLIESLHNLLKELQ
jgi:CheY-like chemotaxis protein